MDAYDIVLEARAHLAAGGNLHSKGSGGIPSRLRKALAYIDSKVPVTHTTEAARAEMARGEDVDIEHVTPWKRIAIEIIDPAAADPRSNTTFAPILDGPARDAAHMVQIAERLVQKVSVKSARESHGR